MSAVPQVMIAGAVALAVGVFPASAQLADSPVVLSPQEIVWQPAPAWLPPGAEVAVLYGNPGEKGPFALRVKVSAGYHVPPHIHPVDKVVTLISGKLQVGMEETVDRSKVKVLVPGSFWVVPAGTPDYVFAEEDTVLQLTAIGPWDITYLNPKDHPQHRMQ